MVNNDGDFVPALRCLLNDEDCLARTRDAVRRMAVAVWAHSLSGKGAGRSAEKQRLINEGMEVLIRTALGDYAREVFNPTGASFHVEMKNGNRIQNAYRTGDGSTLAPDSCITPTYQDMGNDFVLMYKMNIMSIAKNARNLEKNLSGEIHEFHRHKGNRSRYLVMLNVTPTVSFRPKDKRAGGAITPERVPFMDYDTRLTLDEEDVPGTFEHRSKTQTVISDIKFDWHPQVLAAMTDQKSLREAILRMGNEAIVADTVDLHGLDRLVRSVILSYDPLNERRARVEAPAEEPAPAEDYGMDDVYPF